MKVNELINVNILKNINFSLLPLIAIIIAWLGYYIYDIRTEQAVKLGKLEARLAALSVLEAVQNDLSIYVNYCNKYSNLIAVYDLMAHEDQVQHIINSTNNTLQYAPQAFALRCEFEANSNANLSNINYEILRDKINNKVAREIDQQFNERFMLDKYLVAHTNKVTMTTPYLVQATSTGNEPQTYQIVSFYRAIMNENNELLGKIFFDVQNAKDKNFFSFSPKITQKLNNDIFLFFHSSELFFPIAKNGEIGAAMPLTSFGKELISNVKEGYDGEYDDTINKKYYFIMAAGSVVLNTPLTLVVSSSYAQLEDNTDNFSIKLIAILVVGYWLVVAILISVNKKVYKNFIEADVIIFNKTEEDEN